MSDSKAKKPVRKNIAKRKTAKKWKPLADKDRIFTNLHGSSGTDLSSSRKRGDWKDTAEFIGRGREWLIKEVKASGLKGRGGAGFLTGAKWGFMPPDPPADTDHPHYFVINADESEPGTCKDRNILRYEPHKLLEGVVLSSRAIGARVCYIYIRGEFIAERRALERALLEARKAGLVGKNACGASWDVEVYIHHGAGAYICGEETALLESLEGKKGMPRLKPPFPAQLGLYGCPTTVNNVETIAAVPEILRRGAKWFANIGPVGSSGTRIYCISGHVMNPCIVEEAMGIPLRDLITEYAGGVKGGWNNLLAIIPGGSSAPLLPAHLCDRAVMDFDSLKELGSALGTGGVIVMDKSTDIIKAMARIAFFYKHESCGQCTPCREGTGWVWRRIERMVRGEVDEHDIDALLDITKRIEGNVICGLGDAAAWAAQGLLRNFRPIIQERVRQRQEVPRAQEISKDYY